MVVERRRAGRRSRTSPGRAGSRSRRFSASCARRTSGQCAESSRPIPANWLPMPGKTNARPALPERLGREETRSRRLRRFARLDLRRLPRPADREARRAVGHERQAELASGRVVGMPAHQRRARASIGRSGLRAASASSASSPAASRPAGSSASTANRADRTRPRGWTRSTVVTSPRRLERLEDDVERSCRRCPIAPTAARGGRRPGRGARTAGRAGRNRATSPRLEPERLRPPQRGQDLLVQAERGLDHRGQARRRPGVADVARRAERTGRARPRDRVPAEFEASPGPRSGRPLPCVSR